MGSKQLDFVRPSGRYSVVKWIRICLKSLGFFIDLCVRCREILLLLSEGFFALLLAPTRSYIAVFVFNKTQISSSSLSVLYHFVPSYNIIYSILKFCNIVRNYYHRKEGACSVSQVFPSEHCCYHFRSFIRL